MNIWYFIFKDKWTFFDVQPNLKTTPYGKHITKSYYLMKFLKNVTYFPYCGCICKCNLFILFLCFHFLIKIWTVVFVCHRPLTRPLIGSCALCVSWRRSSKDPIVACTSRRFIAWKYLNLLLIWINETFGINQQFGSILVSSFNFLMKITLPNGAAFLDHQNFTKIYHFDEHIAQKDQK